MPEISNLQVVVGYDDSAVRTGAAGTSQAVSGLGSTMQTALAGAAVATGAAVAAGLAVGVKAAGDLQQSVANISTIKPEIDTSAVFGALNEMSTRIPATASELGDSLYNVFSSMDVGQEQALQLVETFAKGAAGAGTSAETFGTAAMGVMNAYGLSAKDASAISDMFFDTINKGVVTGDELAASLGPVTQSAKAAGVQWRDLGPMIAAVTKEGGPAAQNMNNLNNLFQKFTTVSAQTAMNKMGVATTDAAGKFREVPAVLTDLKAHLATLSEAERAAALQEIFPDAQARIGAQTLMSQIDFVNEALKSNQEASGSTAAAYEKMSATFNSQSKLLINNLMAIGTAIGAEALPMVTPLIAAFSQALPAAFQTAKGAWTDLVDIFTSGSTAGVFEGALEDMGFSEATVVMVDDIIARIGDAFRALVPVLHAVVDTFVSFSGPIAAFVAGFLGAIAAAGLASAALAGVAAVLGLLLSPLGLVAIAVGLLAAAWVTDFGGIQAITLQLVAIVQQALSGDMAGAFAAFLALLATTAKAIGAQLLLWGQAFVDWIAPMIPPVLDAMADFGKQFLAWIADQIPPIIEQLTLWGREFVAWVAPQIPPLLAALATLGAALLAWLGEQIPPIIAQLLLWGAEFVAWVAPQIDPMVRALGTLALALIDWIIAQVPTIVGKLVEWGLLFGAWVLGTAIPELIKALPGILTTINAWIEDARVQVGQRLVDFGKAWVQGIYDGFTAAWATIGPKITETIKSVFVMPSFGGGGAGMSPLSYNPGGAKGAIDNSSRELFARTAYPYALEAAQGDAKLAQQLIASAISEANAGSGKDLSASGYNFGGIQGVQGTAGSFTALDAGRPRQFAAYNNPTEGFAAIVDLIKSSPRYAPAYANYQRSGDVDRLYAEMNQAGYAEDPNWADKVGSIRRNQVAPATVNVPRAAPGLGDIKISQAQWGAGVGMTPAEAAAACGPYAAWIFAQATGRTPNPAEAEQMARLSGWTEAGMGGTGNFMSLLGREGINAVRTSTGVGTANPMSNADITTAAANAGPLTAFSTPGHYFASTGFDPASGKFNVGETGVYAGGSTWMTVAEMSALMGPIQDIITLGGQMGASFTTSGAVTDQAFQQMGTVVTATGQAMVSASTDAMGNVTRIYSENGVAIGATITDTAGVVTSQWGAVTADMIAQSGTLATGVTGQAAAMATGVTAQTNLMASGALTSVTAMDTGILTTVQTSAGTTIATVTDMQGQVTSQYATLSNGAQLTMGDMAAGVMTSTTDLGTGVMTTVQDMSGNYITTITDLSGNVTSQYTQLGSDVVAQTVAQSEGVQAETTAMSEAVLTSVTDLGDGVLTITQDTSGQMIATVTDMSGNVTSTYTSMGSDVAGAVSDMAGTVVEQFGDVARAASETESPIEHFGDTVKNLQPPDLSDFVNEFKKVEKAANKAADAVKTVEGKGGKKGGGGKDDVFGKAAGGPVNAGQLYIVGEEGPEFFRPGMNGFITPNHMIPRDFAGPSGSGGGSYDTLVVEIRTDDRTAERIYLTGRDIAIRRGVESR